MKEINKFLDENKDMMEKEGEDELEEFFESDEFNNLDEKLKREIFYMKSFYISTKEYKQLENCIKDFIYLIKYINDNDYLHNTHECYEIIIKNYLNQIDDRLKPCLKENQDNFIENIYEFVENLDSIYLSNAQCAKSIIKELKNLQEEILNYKKKINEENKMKFERYTKKLDEYITKKENSINNNIINSNIYNSIDSEEEEKIEDKNIKNNNDKIEFEFKENNNSKTDLSDSYSIDKKNYLKLVQNNNKDKNNINNDINNYIEPIINNDGLNINNDFNNNNINNINSINNINNINNDFNNNNNLKINNINNLNNEFNDIGKNEELKFDIINNKSRIYDSKNSLNNSEKYHDSMIFDFSLSKIISEIVDSGNKEIEEEKVEEIYSEIDNFTNELIPIFDSNNNNEKFSFLKKRYLSDNIPNIKNNQNNNIININNIQNINNNINLTNSNRPAKKKKKGKKQKKEK